MVLAMFYEKQIMKLFIVNISVTVSLFFTGIHWFKAEGIWLSPVQSPAQVNCKLHTHYLKLILF